MRPSPAGFAVRARVRAPPPAAPQSHGAAGYTLCFAGEIWRAPTQYRESRKCRRPSRGAPRPSPAPRDAPIGAGARRGRWPAGTGEKVCGGARAAPWGWDLAALRTVVRPEMSGLPHSALRASGSAPGQPEVGSMSPAARRWGGDGAGRVQAAGRSRARGAPAAGARPVPAFPAALPGAHQGGHQVSGGAAGAGIGRRSGPRSAAVARGLDRIAGPGPVWGRAGSEPPQRAPSDPALNFPRRHPRPQSAIVRRLAGPALPARGGPARTLGARR